MYFLNHLLESRAKAVSHSERIRMLPAVYSSKRLTEQPIPRVLSPLNEIGFSENSFASSFGALQVENGIDSSSSTLPQQPNAINILTHITELFIWTFFI